MALLEASIPSPSRLRISLNPTPVAAPSNYLQLLAESIRSEGTVRSPLMGSEKAGIGAGGRTSALDTGVPEPSSGLDETIYKAKALYACTGVRGFFCEHLLTL